MDADKTTKPRLSISRTQAATEIGLELLGICTSITSDGRIMDGEIKALRAWLQANQHHELLAIRFLSEVIETALADGTVTSQERESIAKAIETVLPPVDRKYAAAMRRQKSAEDKSRIRAEEEAARKARAEQRELNRAIAEADFMVAGTRFDEREKTIRSVVKPGAVALLRREALNKHSPFAITVLTQDGNVVGFVPEDAAIDLAPELDTGALHSAVFKKVLDYDTGPVPVVVARLYPPGADLPGLVDQDSIKAARGANHSKPSPLHSPKSTKSGFWIAAAVTAILSAVILLALL